MNTPQWSDTTRRLRKNIGRVLKGRRNLIQTISKNSFNPIPELLTVEAEIAADFKLPAPVCMNPEDDKFLECAIVVKAGVLVSGDNHLLYVSGYCGIEIVTPWKFLDRL